LYNGYVDKIIYPVLVLALVMVSAYIGYTGYMQKVETEALAKLYDAVAQITVYEQDVETLLRVSDREVRVVGTYRNEPGVGYFASFATTTLTLPGTEPFTFSLANVVSDGDIRFKLDRISGTLPSAAPMGPTWYTFATGAIPAEFQGIAVPGAILDNLALLRDNAEALTLLKSVKDDTTFQEPLTRFVYAMAPKRADEVPAVTAVRERLTGAGTVSIWTDPSLTSVRFMVLTTDDYTSTTTIKSVNIPDRSGTQLRSRSTFVVR
jgi:hypothetical protein